MKHYLSLISLSILVSCSTIDTSRIAPGYTEAYNAIKVTIFGSDNEIDPNLISNIPYASMVVRIGKGPKALMILESVNKDKYTWVSADGVYLVIKNGKIIKTQGLPNNLNERFEPNVSWNQDNLEDLAFISYLSFINPTLNNLKVESNFVMKEEREEKLVFGNKRLKLLEEEIKSDLIGWKETNKYWLDKDYFVWMSTQYISPKLPPIHFEVTKRPSE
tara:strand:- start:278 stop:931 length:654 start_codon:yes stop_codon:yes gene_type:complete